MRQDRWMPIPELRTPGMRRVLEGMRQLDNELACWDELEAQVKPMTGQGEPEQGRPLQ
jgi:hypothetical protein